jgi:hypothetical protein
MGSLIEEAQALDDAAEQGQAGTSEEVDHLESRTMSNYIRRFGCTAL